MTKEEKERGKGRDGTRKKETLKHPETKGGKNKEDKEENTERLHCEWR